MYELEAFVNSDRSFFTERVNHWIEQLRYGKQVDFSIPGEGYGDKKGYIRYQATVFANYKLIKSLPISFEDSILDIGCGKGKMVFYFSRLGFGKSDGIELSTELVCCAEKNMKILNRNSVIINIDATEFDGYGEYNYFYFFNPFGKEIMRLVMDRIKESCVYNPRKVTIIYCNPLCHQQIVESGFYLKYSDQNILNKILIYRRVTGRITNIYSNVE